MEQPEGRIVRHGLEALAVLTLALTSCVSEGQAYGPRFVTVSTGDVLPRGELVLVSVRPDASVVVTRDGTSFELIPPRWKHDEVQAHIVEVNVEEATAEVWAGDDCWAIRRTSYGPFGSTKWEAVDEASR